MLGTWTISLSNVLPAMKTGLATKYAEISQSGTQTKRFPPAKPLTNACPLRACKHFTIVCTIALCCIITNFHTVRMWFSWCRSVRQVHTEGTLVLRGRSACTWVWVTMVQIGGKMRFIIWFTIVEWWCWKIKRKIFSKNTQLYAISNYTMS